MKRSKMAVVGLAALALAAMSAFAVTGAQGEPAASHELTCLQSDHKTIQEDCTGTGTEAKVHRKHDEGFPEDHQFDAGIATVKCSTTHFDVRTIASGKSSSAPTDPTYSGCTAGGLEVHVNMNGCFYEFFVEKTIETESPPEGYEKTEGQGTASLTCEPGKTVTIEITRLNGTQKCHIEIHAQDTIGPMYFRNNSGADPTDMTVEAATATVKATFHTSGSLFFDCGVTSTETHSRYTGNTTVQMHDSEKNPIDARFDDGKTHA